MKMTTRVAYCNMRHYKSKNILIGIAIILTTLLLTAVRNPINRKRYGGSELCGNQ